MRQLLLALPLMLVPVPAAAEQAPAAQAPAAPKSEGFAIPPELTDPAMAEKLSRMSVVLTRVLMDMPVGELEAAMEGRTATAADKARKVRDDINDPEFERNIAAQAAASGKMMQTATKALAASLPSIMKAMEQVQGEMERAVANLPDPTYPKR